MYMSLHDAPQGKLDFENIVCIKWRQFIEMNQYLNMVHNVLAQSMSSTMYMSDDWTLLQMQQYNLFHFRRSFFKWDIKTASYTYLKLLHIDNGNAQWSSLLAPNDIAWPFCTQTHSNRIKLLCFNGGTAVGEGPCWDFQWRWSQESQRPMSTKRPWGKT